MKAYVPPIILKVIITMTNIMLVTSKHMDSFIWTAILDLTGDLLVKVNYKTASEFSFLISHYSSCNSWSDRLRFIKKLEVFKFE